MPARHDQQPTTSITTDTRESTREAAPVPENGSHEIQAISRDSDSHQHHTLPLTQIAQTGPRHQKPTISAQKNTKDAETNTDNAETNNNKAIQHVITMSNALYFLLSDPRSPPTHPQVGIMQEIVEVLQDLGVNTTWHRHELDRRHQLLQHINYNYNQTGVHPNGWAIPPYLPFNHYQPHQHMEQSIPIPTIPNPQVASATFPSNGHA